MTEPMTTPTTLPTARRIDRDLVARDLERVVELLIPVVEAAVSSLSSVRVPLQIPILGVIRIPAGLLLQSLPLGSLRSMPRVVTARVLELDDDELAALVDVVGQELGAWRLAADPVDADQLEAAAPALGHLVNG